ncbi:MAG: hypothetical protein M1821_003627 [Bathelium mastoideum]|nr:MAG: hypothetical protein M1821_003627 [Bathelium mastoideum]KAI9684915.1 MAG: hypothetical protein M1822_005564 [Bathelium mastoideum]
MVSSSSSSSESSIKRTVDSSSNALKLQLRAYRRSVKVDGNVVQTSESRRQTRRTDPASALNFKYELQLEEARRYQVAAGDGGAHLRAQGPVSRSDASGSKNHVTRTFPRIPLNANLEPKVIRGSPREFRTSEFRQYTQTQFIRDSPLPSTTRKTVVCAPKPSRLPTPDLPTLGQNRFCACASCVKSEDLKAEYDGKRCE